MIVVSGLCACVAGPLPVLQAYSADRGCRKVHVQPTRSLLLRRTKELAKIAGLGFANATPGVRTSTGQHKGHPAHDSSNVNSSDRRIVMVGLP